MKEIIKSNNRLPGLYLFVLIALIALPERLQAQNLLTDKITWSSSSAVNQADNSTVHYTCSFVTTGNSSVDWLQKNGSHVSHFTVDSINGAWPDLTKDGEIAYMISNGSITGSFAFKRSSGSLSVRMKLLVDGKPDQDYVFTISSISKEQ